MTIANPRVHIICGICGCATEFNFEVKRDEGYINEGEENEQAVDVVYIRCDNCGSLTGPDELMEMRGDR